MGINSSENEKLPPAPVERRKSEKVQRISISLTESEVEKLKKLAEVDYREKKSISGVIRLALENQDYLESVARQEGKIIIKHRDGREFEFNPIE